MDLDETLTQLRLQKARVQRVILELEQLQGGYTAARRSAAAARRGRKSMGAEERSQVSERMKRYWAGKCPEAATGGGAKN